MTEGEYSKEAFHERLNQKRKFTVDEFQKLAHNFMTTDKDTAIFEATKYNAIGVEEGRAIVADFGGMYAVVWDDGTLTNTPISGEQTNGK